MKRRVATRPNTRRPANRRPMSRRRGTVLIMVVGILAMLFMIGATQLIVARFERETTQNEQAARQIQGVALAASTPSINQLREDVVGGDNTPFNAAWNNGDNSIVEDFADFVGVVPGTLRRSGDLIMASVEPYQDSADDWFNYAVSGPRDALATGTPIPNGLPVFPPNRQAGQPADLAGNGDADGDGIFDSLLSPISISSMYSGSYQAFNRVVPHGGMVLIDRLTHPALLAQVIHPHDLDAETGGNSYQGNPYLLWAPTNGEAPLDLSGNDIERRLRRRNMLPGRVDENTWGEADLRHKLPITLGYKTPTGISDSNWYAKLTPHWWPVDETIVEKDLDWWEERTTAGKPLTDDDYNAKDDLYDRRRLVTTKNNDDILRRQRDEDQLAQLDELTERDPGPDGDFGTADDRDEITTFYNVTNYDPDNAYTEMTAFTGGYIQYGRDPFTGNLLFNKPGLRTPFSLRDTLVDPSTNIDTSSGIGYQASYRRAVQLTGYFLTMLEHTDVPILLRLEAAAQLAVNTIDFADNGDSNGDGIVDQPDYPTYFAWPQNAPQQTPVVEVFGVEKQPYITEAYVKIIYPALADGSGWNTATPQSIYAVELYNPYNVPLALADYSLIIGNAAPLTLQLADVLPAGAAIAPYSYIVLANRLDDVTLNPPAPFVNGAIEDTNFFVVPSLEIENEEAVTLARRSVARIVPDGVELINDAPVEVDRLEPIVGLGDGNRWAQDPDPAAGDPLEGRHGTPTGADDFFVWDSSLQRHKDPASWHFTLARQIVFPLPNAENLLTSLEQGCSDRTRPYQHNLLGPSTFAGNVLTSGDASNQEVAEQEFQGRVVWFTAAAEPDFYARTSPIAPFPVVTADRGIDPDTKGSLAFPTTGSLLLVSRYSHLRETSGDIPVTVAAADADRQNRYRPPDGQWVDDFDPDTDDEVDIPEPPEGLWASEKMLRWRLDNGHLPIFDPDQLTTDLSETPTQGRLNVPWGQLVFDYFTALPLEELFRPTDLVKIAPVGSMVACSLVDLVGNTQFMGNMPGFKDKYELGYNMIFGFYPLVEFVRDGAGLVPGAKVRGRINVNFAPWWVLDGLPVLPDAYNAGAGLLGELPVPQLLSTALDPPDLGANARQAGANLLDRLIDELDEEPPAGLVSIGPDFAQYIVSYREQRPVEVDNETRDAQNTSGNPGFVTVGTLCDVVTRVPIEGVKNPYTGEGLPAMTLDTLRQWRDNVDDLTRPRPFSYLGYLQLVAPIVRMQDWTTVKNHVYTVYTLVGDSSDPPTWLRTQTTVDRTRCLYTNELPNRMATQEPIGYYNAISDQ